MKKNIFIILMLFNSFIIFSQSTSVARLSKGSVHYIFEKSVNVRSDPALESDKIGRAVIGEKVKIIDQIDAKEDLYGLTAYWYEVEWNNKTGYIWGGLISTLETEGDFDGDGRNELVLSLCTGTEDIGEYMATYSQDIKICRKGQLIAVNPFINELLSSSYIKSTNAEEFNPPISLLEISYGFGDGPGGHSETQLFYWYNGKFILLEKLSSGYSFEDSDEIAAVLPSDENGEYNIIKIEKRVVKYEYDEGMSSTKLLENSKRTLRKYKWNGKTFNKL